MPSLVERVPDVWRDHHIASILPDSIQAIDITLHGRRFSLVRQASGWTVGGQKADSAKMGILLAQFRNLDASGFGGLHTTDSLRRAPARGQRAVTVQGRGARTFLALILDSAAGGFWATRPGDSVAYRLDAYQVMQLTPAADSLRARR